MKTLTTSFFIRICLVVLSGVIAIESEAAVDELSYVNPITITESFSVFDAIPASLIM